MVSTSSELGSQQLEQLILLRNLLVAWNRRFNLTAISDADGIDRKLIADALRMLPSLDDAVAAARSSGRSKTPAPRAESVRLIDVGTGAGFPGMVLKIARPELEVTLVEATAKKVGFLQHVIGELRLSGIEAIHSRSEELAHDTNYRGQYDIVTARAVASLPTLLEFCIPFLRLGGHGIFPKGAEIAEELAMGERAAPAVGARIVGSERLRTGEGETVTRLVIAVKIALTPDRYPRRAGVPVKDPLGRVVQ